MRWLSGILLLWLFVPKAWALESYLTPERVLIVANKHSPFSREVADFYRKIRRIPRKNVLLLSLPRREEISRPIYLKYLERPLATFLQAQGLADQILVLVLMPEVPHKIKGRVARDGEAASVDSELTLLYRKMLYGPYRLGGWLKNPYFHAPENLPFDHDRFDIYLVTRLAGYRPEDVYALIKRAVQAKDTTPPYTLVLDAKDGPLSPGDNWLYATYLRLKGVNGLRFLTSFEPAFLASAQRVIGYASWGSNDPNYPRNRRLFFEFLPGAVGVTFVSTNARTFAEPPPDWQVGAPWHAKHKHFGGSPQSLIGDLIRLGITGISGNVYEPYLSASARPHLLFPAYLAGKPLAEAYYRSLAYLSWQTVVIGDPFTHLGKTRFVRREIGPWFAERKRRLARALKEKDHLFLARVYLRLGLEKKAFDELKALSRQKETLPPEAFGLLLALSRNPKLKNRLTKFLKPRKEKEAALLLALLLFEDKAYDQALALAKPLAREEIPEALYLAGRIKLEQQKCLEAASYLEKAIALQPQAWAYLPWLYRALMCGGKKKRAEHIKNKVLTMPELAELWPEFSKVQ